MEEKLNNLKSIVINFIKDKVISLVDIFFYLEKYKVVVNFNKILNEENLIEYINSLTSISDESYNAIISKIEEIYKYKRDFDIQFKQYLDLYYEKIHNLESYIYLLNYYKNQLPTIQKEMDLIDTKKNKSLYITKTLDIEKIGEIIQFLKNEIRKLNKEIPKFNPIFYNNQIEDKYIKIELEKLYTLIQSNKDNELLKQKYRYFYNKLKDKSGVIQI